jgi:Maltokinase N-terminal cap domain
MAVTDGSGAQATTCQVPLTYRAGACAGAEAGLLGTAGHGVLGRRWVYDGRHRQLRKPRTIQGAPPIRRL